MTDPTADAGVSEASTTDPAHRQGGHGVRMDWGPTGAAAVAAEADVAVVVDVLSFTTTLTIACERGITVLPFRWRDERAAGYAAEQDAVLALTRQEAREAGGGLSLSPASMARAEGVERLVLPSPNGSTVAFGLRDLGPTVVGGCLRNAAAVGRWVNHHFPDGVVAVVAAGERWDDGSLRPAVEDLWGAGAVVAALGRTDLSPEAAFARDAFAAVRRRAPEALAECASGRELADKGFGDEVPYAAELDCTDVVPVLEGKAFRAG